MALATDAATKVVSMPAQPVTSKYYLLSIAVTSTDKTTLETGSHGLVTLNGLIDLPDIPGATGLHITLSKDPVLSNP